MLSGLGPEVRKSSNLNYGFIPRFLYVRWVGRLCVQTRPKHYCIPWAPPGLVAPFAWPLLSVRESCSLSVGTRCACVVLAHAAPLPRSVDARDVLIAHRISIVRSRTDLPAPSGACAGFRASHPERSVGFASLDCLSVALDKLQRDLRVGAQRPRPLCLSPSDHCLSGWACVHPPCGSPPA